MSIEPSSPSRSRKKDKERDRTNRKSIDDEDFDQDSSTFRDKKYERKKSIRKNKRDKDDSPSRIVEGEMTQRIELMSNQKSENNSTVPASVSNVQSKELMKGQSKLIEKVSVLEGYV